VHALSVQGLAQVLKAEASVLVEKAVRAGQHLPLEQVSHGVSAVAALQTVQLAAGCGLLQAPPSAPPAAPPVAPPALAPPAPLWPAPAPPPFAAPLAPPSPPVLPPLLLVPPVIVAAPPLPEAPLWPPLVVLAPAPPVAVLLVPPVGVPPVPSDDSRSVFDEQPKAALEASTSAVNPYRRFPMRCVVPRASNRHNRNDRNGAIHPGDTVEMSLAACTPKPDAGCDAR
jgi:hypothetical protein